MGKRERVGVARMAYRFLDDMPAGQRVVSLTVGANPFTTDAKTVLLEADLLAEIMLKVLADDIDD